MPTLVRNSITESSEINCDIGIFSFLQHFAFDCRVLHLLDYSGLRCFIIIHIVAEYFIQKISNMYELPMLILDYSNSQPPP